MPEAQPTGWYPNPFDSNEELFWDGKAWTGEKRPVAAQPADLTSEPEVAAATIAPTEALPAAPPPSTAIPDVPASSSARIGNTLGLVAMILGIVGLVFGLIPGLSFLAWIFALPAIGLGIAGFVRKGAPHGKALAGIIEGGVAMVAGIVISSIILATNYSATDASDDSPVAPPATHIAKPSTHSTKPTPVAPSTPSPTPTATKPTTSSTPYGTYPTAEAQFVSITLATEKSLEASDTTDLQRSTLISSRDAKLCQVTAHRAVNWVGKVSDIGANGDGYAYVEVEIASSINVQTWNNDFSDFEDNTLIKPSEPFFKTLVPMKVGQKVVFSGTFLSSSKSCLEAENLTQTFYGIDPNFIFRFSAVKAG